MPSEQRHISQTEKNENFREAVRMLPAQVGGDFADWEVVALFYAALHYVDAYLARSNIHQADHRQRGFLVANTVGLREIASDYFDPYARSQDARYETIAFTPGQAQGIKLYAYDTVRAQLRTMLGLP